MIQCIMLHFENSKNEIIKDLKVNMEPLDHLSLLRSGSVGSARFWLPGSAKVCESTDPDPRGKISTKHYIKNVFIPKTKI